MCDIIIEEVCRIIRMLSFYVVSIKNLRYLREKLVDPPLWFLYAIFSTFGGLIVMINHIIITVKG